MPDSSAPIDSLIAAIAARDTRPEPFTPSEAPFWDDPWISRQLLAAHLDDTVEAASRPLETMQESVDAFVANALLKPGMRVLDLGCGPGRFAELLHQAGGIVTGIDISPVSIAHARDRATAEGMDIAYQVQDFFTLDEPSTYDLILQAYGEISTIDASSRHDLLRRIREALTPEGVFICDLSTPIAHLPDEETPIREWAASMEGLWRPHPHLVLTEHLAYAGDIACDHYLVADRDGAVAYRMWFQDFTSETVQPVFARAGLRIDATWDGFTGYPYQAGPWLGIVARRDDAQAP
ncbi:MAG: methyltransferase domain-containing protein [Thermomicrobiales bacterium]